MIVTLEPFRIVELSLEMYGDWRLETESLIGSGLRKMMRPWSITKTYSKCNYELQINDILSTV